MFNHNELKVIPALAGSVARGRKRLSLIDAGITCGVRIGWRTATSRSHPVPNACSVPLHRLDEKQLHRGEISAATTLGTFVITSLMAQEEELGGAYICVTQNRSPVLVLLRRRWAVHGDDSADAPPAQSVEIVGTEFFEEFISTKAIRRMLTVRGCDYRIPYPLTDSDEKCSLCIHTWVVAAADVGNDVCPAGRHSQRQHGNQQT